MGRWYIPFSAMDPEDVSRTWSVGISESQYKHLQNTGHEKELARILLVKETVENPIMLVKGWCRPNQEASYVYVGRPDHDYRSLTIETPPPRDQFFLVFVLLGGRVDFWTWRFQTDDSDMPQGLESGELIWQKNQRT
jgi:hypothetical protein